MQDKEEVRTEHGTMDWFKTGKEYVKAVYCHPAFLTYMQSTSCKKPGWKFTSWNQDMPGEIATTSDMLVIPLYWQKVKRN